MSLFICYNGKFLDDNNHGRGCHLAIKKLHQGSSGPQLFEALAKDLRIPDNLDRFASCTTPGITWTTDFERGRLVVSTCNAAANETSMALFRLTRSLDIGSAENLTSKLSSRSATSIMWRNNLAHIAWLSQPLNDINIAQNIPSPQHPDYQGWQTMTVRKGLPALKSSTIPSIMDVPNGAGYVYVFYTNQVPGTWTHTMHFAVLDNELYELAQDNAYTYWTTYDIEPQYKTTDSFSAVLDESVIFVVYRGQSGELMSYWIPIDDYGLPKVNSGAPIRPGDHREIPQTRGNTTRGPVCALLGDYLYAFWQTQQSNRVAYAYTKRNMGPLSWTVGGELAIEIHSALALWGFSVAQSPQP